MLSDLMERPSDMPQDEIDISGISYDDINLLDSKAFADRVPHEWFAFLRRNAPVWWHEEEEGPGSGP